MRKTPLTQYDFSGGELSPYSYGSTQEQRYHTSLAEVLDFLPLPEGPITNRPGTHHILRANDQTGPVRLLPHNPDSSTGFLAELSPAAVRILADQRTGPLELPYILVESCPEFPQAVGRYVASGMAPYSNFVQILEEPEGVPLYEIEYNLEAGRMESLLEDGGKVLDFDGTTWRRFIDEPTYAVEMEATRLGDIEEPLVSSVLYAAEDLQDVRYTYSGDVLYLTHRKYPPALLYRTSGGSWRIEPAPLSVGPFASRTLEDRDIELTVDDFDFRLSIHDPDSDFSIHNPGEKISYRYGDSFVLAEFVSLDLSDPTRAIVKPVELIVSDIDPSARFEYQATSFLSYLGAFTTPTVSSDSTVFTSEMRGSWLRFRDISSDGTGEIVTWVQINNHLGTDLAGSGFFYHGGTNPAEVDVVACSAALTGVPEYPNIRGVATVDADGAPLNEVTVRASDPVFTLYSEFASPGHDVGRHIQLEVNGGLLTGTILYDAGNSPTQALVSMDGAIPYLRSQGVQDTYVASDWRLGAFYAGNYPAACAIFNQRLVFAGTTKELETVWYSRVGSYFDFSPREQDLSVTDSTAFSVTLGGRQSNPIRWLHSGTRLLIGTEGAFWSTGARESVFSATGFYLDKHDDIGSQIQPVQIGGALLLVHISGRYLVEVEYSDQVGTYLSDDGSSIPNYLFRGPGRRIVDIQVQRSPRTVLWILREDGLVVTLTPKWYRSGRTYGVARHRLGAGSQEVADVWEDELGEAVVDELGVPVSAPDFIPSAQEARCSALAPIFSNTDGTDSVYFVTSRGPASVVERMDFDYEPQDENDRDGMLYLDGVVTLTSEAPATEWGDLQLLSQFLGSPVTILLDGVLWKRDYELPAAFLTTPAARTLQIGYRYCPTLKLLPLSNTSQYGNTGQQGRLRKIHAVLPTVHRTLGFRVGHKLDTSLLRPKTMVEENFKNNEDILSDSTFYSGSFRSSFLSGGARDTEVFIQQTLPYPCTILSLTIEAETQ